MESLHFMGKYNPSLFYSYGDMVTRGDAIWICTSSIPERWEIIKKDNIQERLNEEVEITTQCRNCGAPTRENGTCPYCGTINRKVKKFYVR